jgi:hypothetical protein
MSPGLPAASGATPVPLCPVCAQQSLLMPHRAHALHAGQYQGAADAEPMAPEGGCRPAHTCCRSQPAVAARVHTHQGIQATTVGHWRCLLAAARVARSVQAGKNSWMAAHKVPRHDAKAGACSRSPQMTARLLHARCPACLQTHTTSPHTTPSLLLLPHSCPTTQLLGQPATGGLPSLQLARRLWPGGEGMGTNKGLHVAAAHKG